MIKILYKCTVILQDCSSFRATFFSWRVLVTSSDNSLSLALGSRLFYIKKVASHNFISYNLRIVMVLGGASMALITGACLNERFRLLHFMWVQWEYTCHLRYMYFGFCRLLIIHMPFLKATWRSYSVWWLWYLTNFWEPRR